ncbi:helix-turn-helix domain-containing protein [uncultured Parolsenella sp.]|uniref:helix-turn-helix domain-containing protein n=1 Tax=uncultured Parolsenella sp. TaxID=2083008 RepID=UPI0027D94AD6|nr:helix-turn-helix domain-containing protein [uncultured Parolsenella sp.]
MKPATSEALAHLVSMYVMSIENHGGTIPEATVGQLATEPLKALETLNDFAVALGAVDEQLDSVLQAIYESMDAADARSDLDDASRTQVLRAYADAHREPLREEEAEAGEATASDEHTNEEPAPKRKRKRRSKAEGEGAGTPGSAPESDKGAAEPEADQDATEGSKPRRTRKRAGKPNADKPAQDAEPENPSSEATTAPAAEHESGAAAMPASDAAAPAEDKPAEVLTVDQTVKALGVSRPTVYKLIESGELPAYKKGRSWQISAEAVAKRANG